MIKLMTLGGGVLVSGGLGEFYLALDTWHIMTGGLGGTLAEVIGGLVAIELTLGLGVLG